MLQDIQAMASIICIGFFSIITLVTFIKATFFSAHAVKWIKYTPIKNGKETVNFLVFVSWIILFNAISLLLLYSNVLLGTFIFNVLIIPLVLAVLPRRFAKHKAITDKAISNVKSTVLAPYYELMSRRRIKKQPK